MTSEQIATSLYALNEQAHKDDPNPKIVAGLAVDLLGAFLCEHRRIADALEQIAKNYSDVIDSGT